MEGEITRSKDGVPQWSGDAKSFQDYEEQALRWEQSIAIQKRYLCGPRLQAELQGIAKKLVVGKRADWLSYTGGVTHLLDYLRQRLGKPQIPDLSDYLNQYFRQSKRRKFETMNNYIVRKVEIYARARQALARVQRHYGRSEPQPSWSGSGRSQWDGSSSAQWDGYYGAANDGYHTPRNTDTDDEAENDQGDQEADDSWEQQSSWHHSNWGYQWHGW